MSLLRPYWRTLPTAKCASPSTIRKGPSRRARPLCFTTAIWSSAADGLPNISVASLQTADDSRPLNTLLLLGRALPTPIRAKPARTGGSGFGLWAVSARKDRWSDFLAALQITGDFSPLFGNNFLAIS